MGGGGELMRRIPRIRFPQRHPKASASGPLFRFQTSCLVSLMIILVLDRLNFLKLSQSCKVFISLLVTSLSIRIMTFNRRGLSSLRRATVHVIVTYVKFLRCLAIVRCWVCFNCRHQLYIWYYHKIRSCSCKLTSLGAVEWNETLKRKGSKRIIIQLGSETLSAASGSDARNISIPRSDVPAPPTNMAVGGKATLQPKRTPVSDREIEAILVSTK